MKCSAKCMYFPMEPQEITEEYKKDGVKHRKVVRKCRFSGKIIEKFEECDNFDEGKSIYEEKN